MNTVDIDINNDDEYEEYRRQQIKEDMEEIARINGEIDNEEEEAFRRDGHRGEEELL